MPLPFILAGVAILAGGYGIKKGVDAKSDFDTAENINNEAKNIFDIAKKGLEIDRKMAQEVIEKLGKSKFSTYKNNLIPFVETFSKIKNIDFKDECFKDNFSLNDLDKQDILKVQEVAFKMKEIIGGGITALGSGGLAGLATYGGVGMLASASTGTAIAGLSGAAATNATLAWLGGGALSAGGFGIAGGTAVLGGIVAGPVLAIGGMMLASKAEAAKHDAYTNRNQAKVAAEQMKSASLVTRTIKRKFKQVNDLLITLNSTFCPLLSFLCQLVDRSSDYSSYTINERKGIMMAAILAKTIKNLLETPLLDENGLVTNTSNIMIDETTKTLDSLNFEIAK